MPDRHSRMALRHALFYLAIPILIAFAVSSPSELAFWVVLMAASAIVLPIAVVVAWFHLDIRRIKRQQRDAGRS